MAEIRPRDVYSRWTKWQALHRLRELGWRVIAFRAPLPGEYWVSAVSLEPTNGPTSGWMKSKRLIVEKL